MKFIIGYIIGFVLGVEINKARRRYATRPNDTWDT